MSGWPTENTHIALMLAFARTSLRRFGTAISMKISADQEKQL
jgi:hypothetical protein